LSFQFENHATPFAWPLTRPAGLATEHMGLLNEIRSRTACARSALAIDEAAARQQPRQPLRAIENLTGSTKGEAPRPRTVACGTWRPVRFERNAWPSELQAGEGTLDALAQLCSNGPAQPSLATPTDMLIRAHQEKLSRGSPRHKHYSRFCRDRYVESLSPPLRFHASAAGSPSSKAGRYAQAQGTVGVCRRFCPVAAREGSFDCRGKARQWWAPANGESAIGIVAESIHAAG
jgi:hypothetical protein